MDCTYWLLLCCIIVIMFCYNPYVYDVEVSKENAVVLSEMSQNALLSKQQLEMLTKQQQKTNEILSNLAIHSQHQIANSKDGEEINFIQSQLNGDSVPYHYRAQVVPYTIKETQIGVQYSNRTLPDFGQAETNIYDYPNITYPIPFNVLYNDYTSHYVNYGKPDSRFPDFIHLGDVRDEAFSDSDFVVVTGSSENHLLSNINTMYSIVYNNCNISIVFVDYGISEEGIQLLVQEMSHIHQIHLNLNSKAELYYRKFNFEHFPSWWNITEPLIRGGYSWKVVSYFDVLNQTKRIINWTDGGSLWSHSVFKDETRVKTFGLFTPYSGDSLQSWVHPKSRIFLEKYHMVRKIFTGKGMCTGGYIFVDYHNETVMNDVIFPLLQCAYTRKCVSPLGTSRRNHRQDQAILSSLVHSAKIPQSCSGRYTTMTGFQRDCKKQPKCEIMKNRTINAIAHRYGEKSLVNLPM